MQIQEKFYELFGDICDAVDIEHIYDSWAVNDINLDYGQKKTGKTRYGRDMIDIGICRRLFTSCDIMPDGQVTQTCHVILGPEKNIYEMSLYDQWNGWSWDQERLKMLTLKRNYNQHCRKCQYLLMTYHPEDLLDGHEDEILARMQIGEAR